MRREDKYPNVTPWQWGEIRRSEVEANWLLAFMVAMAIAGSAVIVCHAEGQTTAQPKAATSAQGPALAYTGPKDEPQGVCLVRKHPVDEWTMTVWVEGDLEYWFREDFYDYDKKFWAYLDVHQLIFRNEYVAGLCWGYLVTTYGEKGYFEQRCEPDGHRIQRIYATVYDLPIQLAADYLRLHQKARACKLVPTYQGSSKRH